MVWFSHFQEGGNDHGRITTPGGGDGMAAAGGEGGTVGERGGGDEAVLSPSDRQGCLIIITISPEGIGEGRGGRGGGGAGLFTVFRV